MKQNTSHCDLTSFCRECSARALTPVLAPKFFIVDFFLSNYWKKNCTLWFDEFLLSMQCAARLVQFWRQKDKNDGSALDFRKNPHFIEETRRFFSQSHHDPQDSRLKIFPGLAFGGPPTFFARANFNRYRNEVENHSLFKFLCFQRFHEIFPKLSSDLKTKFWKMSGVVYYYHT